MFHIALLFAAPVALAGEPAAVFGDLDALHPQKLNKEQVEQLRTGARMSRVTPGGGANNWINEPGGAFAVSTDSRSRIAATTMIQVSSSPGTWNIFAEGQYCLTIEWTRVPTES